MSAFQIHFASRDILTPGGQPNVLVAMNPAALKTNLPELERGGIVIVNEDGFTEPNLRKAEYDANPLEDGTLDDYQVLPRPDDLDDRARRPRASTGSPAATRPAPRTSSRSGWCRGCTAARST